MAGIGWFIACKQFTHHAYTSIKLNAYFTMQSHNALWDCWTNVFHGLRENLYSRIELFGNSVILCYWVENIKHWKFTEWSGKNVFGSLLIYNGNNYFNIMWKWYDLELKYCKNYYGKFINVEWTHCRKMKGNINRKIPEILAEKCYSRPLTAWKHCGYILFKGCQYKM